MNEYSAPLQTTTATNATGNALLRSQNLKECKCVGLGARRSGDPDASYEQAGAQGLSQSGTGIFGFNAYIAGHFRPSGQAGRRFPIDPYPVLSINAEEFDVTGAVVAHC
jgi:hypothetical protein